MSLGLLARDSIMDLAALGKDEGAALSPRPSFSETERNKLPSTAHSSPTTFEGSNNTNNNYPPVTSQTRDGASSVLASQAIGRSSSASLASLERRQRMAAAAATKVEKEANPQQPPSFQYAGFSDDYYYDSSYTDHDPYAPNFTTVSKKSENVGGLLGCLFPWLQTRKIQEQRERESSPLLLVSPYEGPALSNNVGGGAKAAAGAEEDAESSNSDVLGERLSDKERQAVLARLRLAQPESMMQHNASSNDSHQGQEEELLKHHEGNEKSRHNKGLLSDIPDFDTSPQGEVGGPLKLKGILKKRSTSMFDERLMKNGILERNSSSQGDAGGTVSSGGSGSAAASQQAGRQRRSLFPSYEDRRKPRTTHSVMFTPMARVVTVKSKNDMADEEKGDIWWQRSDYEDFRKTGRIITRAMLEGGSEIWLASNEASLKKKKEKVGANDHSATGDKWWHTFGHSRRGLEHVVSIDEGRQRQINVKNAIRAVLEEQSRQKMYKREDPEKLRTIALYHTTWARDLALASGASDADAVESRFAEDRRSREFYLLKMSRNKPSSSVKTGLHVPQFMQPAMHRTIASSSGPTANVAQQRLDAHTAAQIQFRRQKLQVDPSVATSQQSEKESSEETTEQVHDPAPEDKTKESLAQQAAGFSADGEKVNMAAVLSGMGAVLAQKDKRPSATRVVS